MQEQKTHKEVLNKHKLTMLQEAAAYIKDSMQNDFPLRQLSGSITDYNNFQKLRYHGLIHHVRVNGAIKRGSWLITKNGWAFLRGDIALPKWVLIQGNRIVQRSIDEIRVQQVYFGSDAIHTTFEYFDESGQPVGIRPASPFARQGALAL